MRARRLEGSKHHLIDSFLDKQGNVKDYRKAFPTLLLLAQDGDAFAQNVVGFCLDTGSGVRRNKPKAMYWYRLAAKGGSTEAMGNLALRYEQASRLPRDKRRALALYKRGAELGDAWCQNNLACRYWDQGDDAKAMLWIRKAARGNGPKAQFNLGMAYLHGEGTRKNHRWAALWLQRAADNGHAKAKRALGRKAERTLGSAG